MLYLPVVRYPTPEPNEKAESGSRNDLEFLPVYERPRGLAHDPWKRKNTRRNCLKN